MTQFLNDTELIQLLKKLRHSLVEGGIIVIRENSAPKTDYCEGYWDGMKEYSLARSIFCFKQVSALAGFSVVAGSEDLQTVRDEHCPVYCFAIRPADTTNPPVCDAKHRRCVGLL